MVTAPFRPHRARAAIAALLAAALAGVSLAGCSADRSGERHGSIALVLRVADSRALTPEGDFAAASYLLEGVGPNGAAFSLELAAAQTVIQDLAAGSWILAATARNAACLPVGRGEAAAEVVADQTLELAILLYPVPGDGALELAVSWRPDLAEEPLVQGEIVASAGDAVGLEFTTSGPGEASSATASVPAAWYTLVVRLYDGATLVAGAADAVLIRADCTTRGAVDLGGPPSPGSGAAGITLTTASPEPIALIMAGQRRAVGPLEEFVTETFPSEGLAQAWYLDGVALGTGAVLSLVSPVSLGGHRLDAVCVDEEGVAAGSVSHCLAVEASGHTGLLTPAFSLRDGDYGVQGMRGARAATLSPDLAHLYVSAYDADSISVFARSTATGLLRYLGRASDGEAGVEGLDGAEGIALSPDGRHVYVAGYTDDAIAAFSVGATGALSFIASYPGFDGIRTVAPSPDGAFLYAAVSLADSVAVLARDADTGTLELTSYVSNGLGGLTHLEAPTDIAVAPDGAHLYVTAYTSDAVSWFGRDPATGALTPLGFLHDGEGGVEGLNGAHGLSVSPDGRSVLVAAYYDRALTVFSRDQGTGSLGFVQAAVDGTGGVEGLSYARDVAISPDSATVYVSGGGDDAVACFRRDPEGLGVSFLEAVAVPDGPRGLALSSDGRSLYVCSSGAGALATLTVSP